MKSYLLLLVFFFCMLCFSHEAFAEEDLPTDTPNRTQSREEPFDMTKFPEYDEMHGFKPEHVGRESDTFQAKFLNMLFLLGLLVAFMILASWALKRMMRSKITQLNIASNIKVMETRQLSPRSTLYIVEVQDKAFLIAETPTSVTYLATLPSEEERRA